MSADRCAPRASLDGKLVCQHLFSGRGGERATNAHQAGLTRQRALILEPTLGKVAAQLDGVAVVAAPDYARFGVAVCLALEGDIRVFQQLSNLAALVLDNTRRNCK